MHVGNHANKRANMDVTNNNMITCSRKLQFHCHLHTVEYHYLFEGHKVFEYQTEADLLNRPAT